MAKKKLTNADFVHLHNHTEYSTFDGLNKVNKFPAYAAKMGFESLAITDHGNMGGAFKFMNECKKVGIKPIVGSEFYLAKDRHVHFKHKKDKRGNVLEEGQTDGRKGNRHLVLIAKNWTGYQNLCRLSQASWTEGYAFQDPRIDFDLLEKHHEGLICSSACFDENQLVSTGQGLKRIVELSMSDDIIDMHGNRSSPSALTSRQFSGRMYHFGLNGSFFSLNCTEDHKIFVDRNGNQIWERAEEIQDNDFFLSPVLEEIDHEENLWDNVDDFFFYARSLKGIMSKPVHMSTELCFLAGAYLAEGHVSSGGRIGWTLSIDEEEYAQEISNCCYDVFGIRPEQSERRANSRIDLVICSAEIRRFFLTYFGSKADGKFISSIFLHANKECKEQLLRGAFLGDGSFKRVGNGDWNSSKFAYASISRSLLWGLWQIAISVGLRLTTIANDEIVSKDGVRHRKSYYMYAYGSDAHAINLLMSNEADWHYPINKCDKSKKINFSNCGKYVKLPIGSINCKVVQDKTVYCLTENQTNAFLAHGLIVHNCLSSVVNANLLHDRYDQARKAAGKFKELFGEDFFLEVMYHGIDAEAMIIPDVLKLSDDLNCKCIASNDCHYCEKCQGISQELLMAMSTSKCLTDPKHIHFPFNEFYLKSVDDMQKHFGSHPQLLTNTVEIAASVDSEDIMENLTGKMRLPRYPIPEDFTNPYHYLEHLAYQGLKDLGWDKSPEHVERLKMELRDVQVVWENNRYDFATYFLVVRDYIIAAKDRDIIVGCGRGCLSPDSLVYMATGEAIPIIDVKETEVVIDQYGNPGMVVEKHEYDCDEEMLRIKTYQGDHNGICLTKDHKVLAQKQQIISENIHNKHLKKYATPSDNDLEWVQASDLNVGDWMFIPKFSTTEQHNAVDSVDLSCYANSDNLLIQSSGSIEEIYRVPQSGIIRSIKSIESVIEIDECLMWILGKFIADGWLRKGPMRENAIYFAFHSEEKKQQDYISKYFSNIGCKIHMSKHRQKKLIQTSVKSICIWKMFNNWFPDYEQTSQTKYIPEFVFDLDRNLKIALIQGLFAGDGHCNRKSRKFIYTTVSERLAYQLRFLLLDLGIPSSVSKESRGSNTFTVRTLMHDAIDCGSNGYNNGYEDRLLSSRLKMSHISEKGVFVKIRSIETEKSSGKVYDLTVDTDSSYLTTSGIVHNSGFGSVLLRCLNISYGPDPLKYGLLWERFLGFDDRFFISERDFGFGDDTEVKNAALEAKNSDFDEARDVEDDMGGVDRY